MPRAVKSYRGFLRPSRKSKKKAAIRFSLLAAIKEARGKLDLRIRKYPGSSLGAHQTAPQHSCDPDQAGREQHQATRFRCGQGRSSIADEFLRSVARASADSRVQRQPLKFVRRSVFRQK